MFDWLRRQDKTQSGQVAAPKDAPGKAQPLLESRSVGQALPELVPPATTAVDGATTGGTESFDVRVDGSSDETDDAGAGQKESRELGAVGPSLDGSQPDESARSIGAEAVAAPPLSGRGAARRPVRRLVKPEEVERAPLTAQQRLWILDTWKRSGLPAGDSAPLVGVSKHTRYSWKKQFTAHGPAGLMEQKRGVREGSRLPELTKRTILLLKESHPEWGCERISAMLLRGTSQFTKELQKQGIRQIVAAPRRPQTLGKIERFWGTLWRECVETSVFVDLADAQARIGHFIDYYNFQRTHSGIDGLVPADRFFGAAPDVLRTLKDRVASNACELARQGVPKPPFYMTGQAIDKLPQLRRAEPMGGRDEPSPRTGGEA